MPLGDPDPEVILRDTAGHPLGVVEDAGVYRLATEADLAPGAEVDLAPGAVVQVGLPLPEDPTNIVRTKLLNGGSPDLRVDGSVTPVTFQVDADPTKDILFGEVRFVMTADVVLFQGDKFGPYDELTNGILFEVQVAGVSVTLDTIKVTEHFLTFPRPETFFDRGGPKEIFATGYYFGGAPKLVAGSGDYLRIVIQDNLDPPTNKIQHFEATFWGTKVG